MATADTTSNHGPVREVASWLWDNRDPMAPVWCAAGALVSGAVAHGLHDHLWGGIPPVVYGAVVAWRLDRDRSKALIRTRAATVFHSLTAASFGIWMIPTTLGGLTPTLAAAVGAGFAGLGAAWWLRPPLRRIRRWYRHRKTTAPQAPAELTAAPQPRALTSREQLVEDWETYLNVNGGPMLGVHLRDVEELAFGDGAPYAVRAVTEGIRGRHKTKELVAAAETIRSGLGLTHGTVLMDGTAMTGNSARLTVLTGDNPLRHLEQYEGPEIGDRDPSTLWQAQLGRFADRAPVLWTYYTPGSGAEHGIIAADSGMGKGVTLDKVLIGAVAVGAVVLFLDPKDGRSSSVLPLATAVAATTEERRLLLSGIEAEMRRRNSVMAAQQWTDGYGNIRNTVAGSDPQPYFIPTEDMPLLYIPMDEIATQTEDEEFAAGLGPVTREGRACGLGFVAIGQGVSIRETGGAVVRSQLAKNIIMLYTKNSLTNQRLGDEPGSTQVLLDPHDLPLTWPGTNEPARGLCVPAGLCAAGRAEMGRIHPNGDLVPIVNHLLPGRSTLSAIARATLKLDELAEMRDHRLAGRVRVQVPTNTPTAGQTEQQDLASDAADASARELVLQILHAAGGELATAAILERLKAAGRPMSPSALGNLMGKLVGDGLVTRTRHGFYEAVAEAELLEDDTDLVGASAGRAS